MTKPRTDRLRPFPYKAAQLIDTAIMANSDAVRANREAGKVIMELVRGRILDPAEKMARLAEIANQIHESTDRINESTAALKEARAARPENGE